MMTDAIKTIAVRLAVLLAVTALIAAAGCFDLYQSQTTVIGVEVAYDPMQSAIPTARAGVITHRQQAAAKSAAKALENNIQYYNVELWRGAGNVSGTMTAIPAD